MADTIELKLKLNLKRFALISVAEALWRSSNNAKRARVTNRIFTELQLFHEERRFFRQYKEWEKIVDEILNAANDLGLPSYVKADLDKTIILLGEKVYYFREHYPISECMFCKSVIGSSEYYFSNNGVMTNSCLSAHWKYVPPNDFFMKSFMYRSCCLGDSKTISKYKKEAIAYLKGIQPELNLEDKKNIELNIVSVFQYMNWFNSKSKFRVVPQNYLKNTDYIIPLDVAIKEFGIGDRDFAYVNYYKYLNSHNLLLDLLPCLDMFSNLEGELRKVCNEVFACPYRFEHLQVADFLDSFQLLPSHQIQDFIQKNGLKLIVALLPAWPYQEIVPDILEFLFEKNVNLDYEFLLEFVALNIGVENKLVHKAKKPLYLRLFHDLWCRTPESVKMGFLVDRITIPHEQQFQDPIIPVHIRLHDHFRASKRRIAEVNVFISKHKEIIPILLSEEDREKSGHDLHQVIAIELIVFLFKTENFRFLRDFVNRIVIGRTEFTLFGERHGFVIDKFWNKYIDHY